MAKRTFNHSVNRISRGIAVRFACERHDDRGNRSRSYGNANWEFDNGCQMPNRFASIDDLPIKDSERKYHWPLGRRPDGHPGLSGGLGCYQQRLVITLWLLVTYPPSEKSPASKRDGAARFVGSTGWARLMGLPRAWMPDRGRTTDWPYASPTVSECGWW